ncbi:MAG: AsmA-like C-terminal region-containing protein [Candidatus Tenebribacter davisii]|nr:AsmA-like C-terminal region-containing protein [Candidatus Tenebribacter davisii]
MKSKKAVKGCLFTFVGFIVLIIAILVLTPLLFKGKILDKVQTEINKNVNAEVTFEDFKISFFKSFPNLSLELTNLNVNGIDEFKEQKLISVKSIYASVNVVSAIKGKIDINAVVVENPEITAKVLANGMANWDVAKEVQKQPEEKTAKEIPDFNIGLNRFEVKNAIVSFIDQQNHLEANIQGLNFLMKGGITQDFSSIDIKTSIDMITVISKAENAELEAVIKNQNVIIAGDVSQDFVDLNVQSVLQGIDVTFAKIKYLKNTKVEIKAGIGMDVPNMKFTFKDNEVKINQLVLGFEGDVQTMDKDMILDIKFDAKKTDFKNILSFIPAIYMTDFQDIKTSGKLAVNGFAKGTVSENSIPAFGVNLLVENAMFQYPDLPESVDNINVKVNVSNDGGGEDNTKVNVNKFHVELAGNPFDAKLSIKNPISDPYISGNFNGKIDLGSLKDALPIKDISLNGLISTNIDIGGRMSAIEKQQFEKFKVDGNVTLSDFKFTSKDLPQEVTIRKSSLNFTPRYVELASFDSKIGRSDLKLVGRIENFLPFIFKDETIKGNFTFTSNVLDMNELIVKEEQPEQKEGEEITLEAIEIPSNIDFKLTSNLKQIYFDKIDIKNTKGVIRVRNGKASLENLKMDMLDGNIILNGSYDSKNIQKPAVDFTMKITNFDVESAVETFNTMEKLAPIMKDCKGKFNTDLTFVSNLDSAMQPVLKSINGRGKITSQSIQVVNPKSMQKLAEALKMNKYKKFTLKNLNLNFTIVNGVMTVKPFTNKIHNSRATIGGTLKTDQSVNFDINLIVPRSEFASGINNTYDDLIKQANTAGLNLTATKTVEVDVKITGNVTDPKVKLDTSKSVNKLKAEIKKQVAAKLEKEKDKLEEKALDELEKLKKKFKW